MSRRGAESRSTLSGSGIPDGCIHGNNLVTPIRAAAYIRVSTDSDDQENSYETQVRYFSAFLQGNPMIESAGIYFDRGITGTDMNCRTGFRRLLRHCEEGRIDRIICKSISRFARNTKDCVETLRRLKELGVTVYFETPGFDTADRISDFVLTTLAAIAQEESRSISKNILDGLEHHYRMGEVRNCDIYGYRYTGEKTVLESGYRCRDIEVVETEAEIVRRVFRSVENGKRFAEIARELNGEGIPAPDRGHKSSRREERRIDGADEGWTGAMISRLVRSERYCGDVIVRKTFTKDHLTHESRRNQGEKEQYRIRDHHTPIISRELFETVQGMIEKNKRGPVSSGNRQSRPLSGILVCGECGRNFHARRTARDIVWGCPTAECRNGRCLCHARKRYESQIRQMIRTAVEARQVQESRKHCPGLPEAGTSRHQRYGPVRVPDIIGRTQFIFNIFDHLRAILEDDHLEQRYAGWKRPRTGNAGAIGETEQTMSGSSGAEMEDPLTAIENARTEAETFREYREKALAWMRILPGGEARWKVFLKGVSGEYLKAFFTRITAKPDGGYVVCWFDGVVTDVPGGE